MGNDLDSYVLLLCRTDLCNSIHMIGSRTFQHLHTFVSVRLRREVTTEHEACRWHLCIPREQNTQLVHHLKKCSNCMFHFINSTFITRPVKFCQIRQFIFFLYSSIITIKNYFINFISQI